MQNQENKSTYAFQTINSTPMLPKSSDEKFGDLGEKRVYNAAIYCRLSKEDEEKLNKGDDSESIQNQKLLLMDYAKAQGWKVINIYSDDDLKGFDRNRPAFNRLLKDAENGLFQIILCKHQSRFTRDMELVEKYIHNAFSLWGIRFVSIVDHVDTDVKGNKKARQINGLINEWYSEDLSENIRSVFRKKMEAGQFLGPFAVYGYMKDPNDHHKLLVDPEAAEVVRSIFDLYLQGYGCQQIANKLTAGGVPTPTAYKQAKGFAFKSPHGDKYAVLHGVWANNSVSRILKNEAYIGTLIQGREKKVSYKSKTVVITPKDEWVIIKNNHEAVIDEKIFYTVQDLMHNRRQIHKPKSGYAGTAQAHLLAGKVVCMDCGSNMQRSAPARNGEHYLRCGLAYKTKAKAQALPYTGSYTCTPHTIKLERLIDLVGGKVRTFFEDYLSDSNEMDFLRKYYIEYNSKKNKHAEEEKELNAVRGKITDMSSIFAQAYTDKVKGWLTEEEFVAVKNTLNIDIQGLRDKQITLENRINESKRKNDALSDPEEELQYCIRFQGLTHEMVNTLINRIEVGEKNGYGVQEIVIHWCFCT